MYSIHQEEEIQWHGKSQTALNQTVYSSSASSKFKSQHLRTSPLPRWAFIKLIYDFCLNDEASEKYLPSKYCLRDFPSILLIILGETKNKTTVEKSEKSQGRFMR